MKTYMLEVQLANERPSKRLLIPKIKALRLHGPSASLVFVTYFYRKLERMNHVHHTNFIRNLAQVGAVFKRHR